MGRGPGDATLRAAPLHQDGVDEAVRVLTGSADSLSFSLVLFHLPAEGVPSIKQNINSQSCNENFPCALLLHQRCA